MIRPECIKEHHESNIKLSDQQSTSAVFNNPKHASHLAYKIDGCAIQHSVACDWVLEKKGTGRIAIELKGADIDHAAEQILATLGFLKTEGLANLKMAALIICSRRPSHDTKVARIQQKLAKHFRAPLRVKTDGRNLEFEQLLVF